jgi:hypothetical protein
MNNQNPAAGGGGGGGGGRGAAAVGMDMDDEAYERLIDSQIPLRKTLGVNPYSLGINLRGAKQRAREERTARKTRAAAEAEVAASAVAAARAAAEAPPPGFGARLRALMQRKVRAPELPPAPKVWDGSGGDESPAGPAWRERRQNFSFKDNKEWKRATRYFLSRTIEGLRTRVFDWDDVKNSIEEASLSGWTNDEIRETMRVMGADPGLYRYLPENVPQVGGRRRKTRVSRKRSKRRKSFTRKYKRRA